MLLRTFFAAVYGHEGRRGEGAPSSCEAHRDMGIRFIKTKCRRRRQQDQERRSRQQQQLAGRVFTQVMIATAKEFPPSFGPVLALPCDSDLRAAPQQQPHEPAQPPLQWAEEERSRMRSPPIACQCRVDVD